MESADSVFRGKQSPQTPNFFLSAKSKFHFQHYWGILVIKIMSKTVCKNIQIWSSYFKISKTDWAKNAIQDKRKKQRFWRLIWPQTVIFWDINIQISYYEQIISTNVLLFISLKNIDIGQVMGQKWPNLMLTPIYGHTFFDHNSVIFGQSSSSFIW